MSILSWLGSGGASTTRTSRKRSARTWRSPPTSGWPTAPIRRSAQLASLKDFGNVTLTTEAARRVWTPWWLDALRDQVSDVRYAIRALAKNPAFSLTVIGVLTLGIGLNAAVFTMLKSMALSPLAGVDGLGAARASSSAKRARDGSVGLSYPDYQYLRDHDRAFSGLFGSRPRDGQPGPRPQRPPDLRRARHRQLLSGARRPRRARPHAAAVGRDRARPPSGRRDQRRPVAPRLRRRSGHRRQDDRDQQLPADRRRRRRSDVSRHDRRSTTSRCSSR